MKTDHLALLRAGAPLTTRQQLSLTLQLSWPAIMAQLATIIMQYIDAATAGVAGRAPLGAVRRMGSHVPGAVRPGHTLSDTAGRQALAVAGGTGGAGIDAPAKPALTRSIRSMKPSPQNFCGGGFLLLSTFPRCGAEHFLA